MLAHKPLSGIGLKHAASSVIARAPALIRSRKASVIAVCESGVGPSVSGRAATTSVSSPLSDSILSSGLQAGTPSASTQRDVKVQASTGGSDGGSGAGSGGGGGGGGDGNSGDDDTDKVLTLSEVEAFAAEKKISLPADMLEIAKKYGLRLSVLKAFAATHALFITGFLVRTMPYFRDRILADPLFLFKVGAEVVIDSGCATVAEVRKRGDDFWGEFEFYLSDLLVGLVLDVVLVSLMAPAAVLGGVSRAAMSASPLKKWLSTIPSAVFEASVPGVKSFSVLQRASCLGVKFLEYSLAGITCGLLGQGLANSIMMLRRHVHGPSEHDVPVPPLLKSALVWGLFMGVSSNVRYQTVFGLERLVDLTIAKRIPQVAYGTTVGIRFVNNVIGGENFIDMARWAGVQ